VPFGDVLLRLVHCLLYAMPRSETVAVFGERRVPTLLQNLQHRLLDESVQHARVMEEVCELENSKQALQRVKANKGSPGVDGMSRSVPARLSDLRFATSVSVPFPGVFGASLLLSPGKASTSCSGRFFRRCPLMSRAAYLPFPLFPLRGTVRAFDPRSRLGLSVAPPFGLGWDRARARRPGRWRVTVLAPSVCEAGSQFHQGCVSRGPPIMPDNRISQVRFEALAFRP
jgi:hypothetical protein